MVELPEWFEPVNRDFRYQLTCIGSFAPVYVSEEIHENQFKIAGGQPGMKVSWQVTGIRQDPWAEAHRIQVEVDKPVTERGSYLHPELYDMPGERRVDRCLERAARGAREVEITQDAITGGQERRITSPQEHHAQEGG